VTLIWLVAIFFVVWWTALFAILPIGVRTQEEDADITLGTTESAPSVPRLGRVVVLTTLVSNVIVGAFWGVTSGLGYDFNDLPRVMPDFG
jgi:predicted secreted protein